MKTCSLKPYSKTPKDCHTIKEKGKIYSRYIKVQSIKKPQETAQTSDAPFTEK